MKAAQSHANRPKSVQHLGPRDLALIRRAFEAACSKTRTPRLNRDADRLAEFITDEFRFGTRMKPLFWKALSKILMIHPMCISCSRCNDDQTEARDK